MERGFFVLALIAGGMIALFDDASSQWPIGHRPREQQPVYIGSNEMDPPDEEDSPPAPKPAPELVCVPDCLQHWYMRYAS